MNYSSWYRSLYWIKACWTQSCSPYPGKIPIGYKELFAWIRIVAPAPLSGQPGEVCTGTATYVNRGGISHKAGNRLEVLPLCWSSGHSCIILWTISVRAPAITAAQSSLVATLVTQVQQWGGDLGHSKYTPTHNKNRIFWNSHFYNHNLEIIHGLWLINTCNTSLQLCNENNQVQGDTNSKEG